MMYSHKQYGSNHLVVGFTVVFLSIIGIVIGLIIGNWNKNKRQTKKNQNKSENLVKSEKPAITPKEENKNPRPTGELKLEECKERIVILFDFASVTNDPKGLFQRIKDCAERIQLLANSSEELVVKTENIEVRFTQDSAQRINTNTTETITIWSDGTFELVSSYKKKDLI